MLNLIKFHDLAQYPADHPDHGQGRTGREAYAIYARRFQDVAAQLGAKMVWQGELECVVTGPQGEWDEAFVMGYPNSAAFFAMVTDPGYKAKVVAHRTAAVKDSRLIRFGG
jgi:uncharacterized protein (DUF1330 family)